MPPKRELSIRVAAHLREALDQAAAEQGQTITAIVETALSIHLGVDGPEQGQTLADRVRELEARVAALEGNASQRHATQRTAPPHTAPAIVGTVTAQDAGEGFPLGEALVFAGAPIPPDVALSSNRARAMNAAVGMGAAAWLASQGWVKHKGKWYRG